MDPGNATVDPTDPGREQYRIRLARLPTTLLPTIHRHSSRLHGQEISHSVKNEVPGYRFLHSRLQTKRSKGSLPLGVPRNESAILSRATERRRRRCHAISDTHHLPRAHREGPRKCTIKSTTPKCIRRKQKLRGFRPSTAASPVE